MNKSINQIRVELSKIVTGDNPVTNVKTGHLQLYSFFWGDFLRAYKENTLNYPVMGAFYPNGSLLRNQTQVQLTIYIADKLYKDWSNLNDIESDTLQICRDVFNVMNHSTRWNKIGRVQSCSVSKFIQKGGDEVAGHEMTIQFLIRDSSSICGLPMVDYDFDQVVGDGCSPVQIYENGVLVDTVASGGIYEYSHGDAHYVITNSVGGILYSGDIAENDTLTQAITDSVATLKDTAGATISTTNILAQGTANIEAPDGSVTVNGAAYDTVVSGGALNVPVVNTVADPVGTIIVGGVLVANSPITVNSISEGSLISEETLDIQLTDGTNPVNPTDVTQVGNTMTIEVPPSATIPCGQTLMKTGQTTSYRTGDDGDLEVGRLTDFLTLASNNPFGNTNRFTDELGGSTYTNNIVIDWSTYNGSNVLGFRRTFNGSATTWDVAIDGALAISIGTFTTGWRLPNIIELFNLCHQGVATSVFNYAPINSTANLNIWSSTTSAMTTTSARLLASTGNGAISIFPKTTSSPQWFPARTFTVTGTTLS